MKKAVVYLRVSTSDQVNDGVSLSNQEEKISAYCKMVGLEVVKVIREEGVSGSIRLSTRPGGQELHHLVTKKMVGHVIALKLDRLFRDAEDALHQTKEWDKLGVALHLVDMGGQTINTATAMGRFFLNMMAGFAELERNLIAERTATAMSFKKSHLQVYSPVPYGYDRRGDELVRNEEEQAVITTIKNMRASGMSYCKMAEILNRDHVPTKGGGKWHTSTLYGIVKNSLHKEGAA
ncbi:MAG: recombinase family protein [Candidatus Eremiobacteraeota bacterium]|nr:recombinase family protein [Candidatus Eremiobacteraeota bacterium]